MKNNRLDEKVIGTANVIVDILPAGRCIPNTKITPTSITIHNTGNIDASAKNNHQYQKNNNKTKIGAVSSWHFTCGFDEIYQAQSTNYKCYHAGNTTGNNTSIGIEICMYKDKDKQLQAYRNAIELVKILLAYYGWGVDKVKRHYDWTKKNCPQWLIEGKYGYTWNWFKEQLTTNSSQPVEKQPNVENVPFLVSVICDELNIRKDADFNSEVVGVLKKSGVYYTIVEVKNGLGKLKSGQGWISINEKYVNKKAIVQEFKPYLARCTVNDLNCRKGAGTNYAIDRVIDKGVAITIVDEKMNGSTKWLKSKLGYWVSAEYMEFVKYVE